MSGQGPWVAPTQPRTIVAAAMIGAGVVAVVGQAAVLAGAVLPQPGVGGWLPVLLLTAVTGWLAWTTRRVVQVRRERLDADVAVTRLRLAKSGVLVAALLGGGYLALAGLSLAAWPVPLAQARLLHSALATASSAAWAVAALLLERFCRVPRDDPE